MEDATGKLLLITLIVSIVVGGLVLLFDKTYRVPYIIASNSSYYPDEADDMIKKYAGKFVQPAAKKSYSWKNKKYTSRYKRYKKFTKKYTGYKRYKKKSYFQKSTKTYKLPTKSFSGVININSADTVQLQKLPGITASLAKKIILFRKIKNGFTTKEDLLKVPGLTEDIFNKIKNNISVE